MSAAAIALSAMLTVAQPGITPGSRIELTADAAAIDREDGVKVSPPGFHWSRATWPMWSRQETEPEALERWATIAVAVEAVAKRPPVEWRWGGAVGELQLTRALVTIARHESAFWRSVHEGRLRGAQGEVCLEQIQTKTAWAFGYDPETLVGVDRESTERCLRVGAIVLAKARDAAERKAGCADVMRYSWFQGAIAIYGSGAGCVPEGDWTQGVSARMRTYDRTGVRKRLPELAVQLLGEDGRTAESER